MLLHSYINCISFLFSPCYFCLGQNAGVYWTQSLFCTLLMKLPFLLCALFPGQPKTRNSYHRGLYYDSPLRLKIGQV